MHVDHARGAREDLERERAVLKRSARRGQKANAMALEEIAPVHGRPDRGLLVEDERIVKGARGRGATGVIRDLEELDALARARPVELEIALCDLCLRRLGCGNQALEALGVHDVIRLQDADVGTPCEVKRTIHGVAVAGVGLLDHADALVLLRGSAHDGERSVRRAVVDADDLDVRKRLRPRGSEALGQVALDVHDGHEQGDAGGRLRCGSHRCLRTACGRGVCRQGVCNRRHRDGCGSVRLLRRDRARRGAYFVGALHGSLLIAAFGNHDTAPSALRPTTLARRARCTRFGRFFFASAGLAREAPARGRLPYNGAAQNCAHPSSRTGRPAP